MESKQPLVSIIIPNYNHAKYVGDAILSILRQTYSNYEIIVVDDGSTDNSREVIAEFQDQVRYIWQENQGLSAARNTGIQAARGQLIGLLDADDMFEADFLSVMVAALENCPEAAAAYSGYRFIDENNLPLPQKEARNIPPDNLYQVLIYGNFMVPENMLVQKRCYEEVGLFDITLCACEDWDMWLRIASHYIVIGVPMLLTRHRILAGSMSSDPLRMFTNSISVLNKTFEISYPEVRPTNITEAQAYSRVYLSTAITYLNKNDVDNGKQYLQGAFLLSPAMARELDVFYELGCANQPKGYRGDFKTLDVSKNEKIVRGIFDAMFADQVVAQQLDKHHKYIYSNMYFALGLLCYGKRLFNLARSYFFHALIWRPNLILLHQFSVPFVKSYIPIKLFSRNAQVSQN